MSTEEKPRYETTALPHPWLIGGGVVAFVLFAAIAMVGIRLVFRSTVPDQEFQVSVFAPPRLQINPAADLRRLDEKQAAKLTGTEWRDRQAGILAIPIDAAMAAIVARGSAAYEPLPAEAQAPAAPERPAAASPPADRQPNPGSGIPDPIQEGR